MTAALLGTWAALGVLGAVGAWWWLTGARKDREGAARAAPRPGRPPAALPVHDSPGAVFVPCRHCRALVVRGPLRWEHLTGSPTCRAR